MTKSQCGWKSASPLRVMGYVRQVTIYIASFETYHVDYLIVNSQQTWGKYAFHDNKNIFISLNGSMEFKHYWLWVEDHWQSILVYGFLLFIYKERLNIYSTPIHKLQCLLNTIFSQVNEWLIAPKCGTHRHYQRPYALLYTASFKTSTWYMHAINYLKKHLHMTQESIAHTFLIWIVYNSMYTKCPIIWISY